MADTKRVNVCQSSESLVRIEFNKNHGNWLFHLVVVLQNAEHGLGNVLHDNVQIDLVIFVALSVKCMFQSDHIRVIKLTHDLELAILVPLVLVHLFDRNWRIHLDASRLVDDAE